MPEINQDDVHSRNITAYFDTRAAADTAVEDLVSAGIPREHISTRGTGTAAAAATGSSDRSFWDELKDMFLPDEDRYAYAEGIRRGGILVSVRSEEANYTRVIDILDRDGAVDLDKREATWRQEGWTGFAGQDWATSTGSKASAASATATGSAAAAGTSLSSGNSSLSNVAGARSGSDEVVPVYEEQLRVGKRDVSHGRVRLRSYVVETPVNEQVSLHNESIQVERRPVDRPVTAGEALFQDRTIEAEERAEEAVVSKDARVKEEVTLRKTADDRTQDIRDTVRHTEVEIQDERSGRGLVGTASAATGIASKIVDHMDVIASDGVTIGTVDHLDGPDRIKLAKTTSPDGQHHYVPLAWVDHVDTHVHLTKTSAEAKAGW